MKKTTSITIGTIGVLATLNTAYAAVPFPENARENSDAITVTTQEVSGTTDPNALAATIGMTGIVTGFIITILTLIIARYIFYPGSSTKKVGGRPQLSHEFESNDQI